MNSTIDMSSTVDPIVDQLARWFDYQACQQRPKLSELPWHPRLLAALKILEVGKLAKRININDTDKEHWTPTSRTLQKLGLRLEGPKFLVILPSIADDDNCFIAIWAEYLKIDFDRMPSLPFESVGTIFEAISTRLYRFDGYVDGEMVLTLTRKAERLGVGSLGKRLFFWSTVPVATRLINRDQGTEATAKPAQRKSLLRLTVPHSVRSRQTNRFD